MGVQRVTKPYFITLFSIAPVERKLTPGEPEKIYICFIADIGNDTIMIRLPERTENAHELSHGDVMSSNAVY